MYNDGMKFKYYDQDKQKWEIQPDLQGHWIAPLVFECEADNVTQADALYKAQTGQDPVKQKNISCLISSA